MMTSPAPGLKRKGGIVQQEIRGGAAVGQENCPRSRICPLVREPPGNLSQKDQVTGDPDRRTGEVHRELAPDFFFTQRRAGIGERGPGPRAKAERMGNKVRYLMRDVVDLRFGKVPDKSDEPSRMIEVSMGQDNIIQIQKIRSHVPCIGKECIRIPGIEQDLLFVGFKEERKPGFA